ncbi:MAG: flagellar biosynthesis protein FlhF [Firmicutes bacterium]|nr:flagellar biosynthesis protein FlhF [Bacillota bacterium]
MQIKRYVAWNVQDALKRVKAELGPDAVILNARKLPWPGFLKHFIRERAEVVAALDGRPAPAFARQPGAPGISPGEREMAAAATTAMKPTGDPVARDAPADPVARELKEIKAAIAQLAVNNTKAAWSDPRYDEIYRRLLDQGVDGDIALSLVNAARDEFESPQSRRAGGRARAHVHPKMLERSVALAIRKMLPVAGPDSEPDSAGGGSCRRVAVIGPTGVGKTTTLAKLAARCALVDHRKVAFVTADTYRVAAVEQLRTYAEILGVPFDVVHTPSEMRTAMERYRDFDLVFIDTSGRSPKDRVRLSELRAFVDAARPDETHIVLSVATKSVDLLDALRNFELISFDRIIFTKLDETSCYGGILNVAARAQKPISYVTAGQDVPDDIEAADAEKLASLIIGDAS